MLEDVQGRTGDPFLLQRLIQRLLIDQFATGDVHDHGIGLHLCDEVSADEVMGGGGQRGMDRYYIGLFHQLLEGHRAHAQLHRRLRRYVWIVADELHLKALRALGHLTADPAQADDAQGLAVQLDPRELGALPLAPLQGRVGPYDVTSQGQHHGHSVLGGGDDVRCRRVHYEYASAGGRLDVDVVHAHACPAYDLEVLACLHHVRGDLGARADDQCVVVTNDVQ